MSTQTQNVLLACVSVAHNSRCIISTVNQEEYKLVKHAGPTDIRRSTSYLNLPGEISFLLRNDHFIQIQVLWFLASLVCTKLNSGGKLFTIYGSYDIYVFHEDADHLKRGK